MPAWRGNFFEALNAIGVDVSSVGFPLAEGAQPVLIIGDLSNTFFPQRRMYGRGEIAQGAPGAGRNNRIELLVKVPTTLHWYSFQTGGGTNTVRARVSRTEGFTAGMVLVAGAIGLRSDGDETGRRNQLAIGDVATADIVVNGFEIIEEGLGVRRSIGGNFDIPAFHLQAGTLLTIDNIDANATLDSNIIWEEQVGGRTPF